MADRTVQVGRHDVVVVAQSVPYLERELGGDFLQRFATGDLQEFAGHLAGSGAVYRVLDLLIPDLGKTVPEHEFHGFPTEQSWQAGDGFDRELGWTMPQLIAALEAVWDVNGLGKIGLLENLAKRVGLDPQMLGEQLRGLMDEATDRIAAREETTTDDPAATPTDSLPSSSSPSPSGGSASTTPSGTAPTSNGHAASPSPVS